MNSVGLLLSQHRDDRGAAAPLAKQGHQNAEGGNGEGRRKENSFGGVAGRSNFSGKTAGQMPVWKGGDGTGGGQEAASGRDE